MNESIKFLSMWREGHHHSSRQFGVMAGSSPRDSTLPWGTPWIMVGIALLKSYNSYFSLTNDLTL